MRALRAALARGRTTAAWSAGQDAPANFLALNQPDNWLHLGSALAGLAIALWPADDRRTDAVADDGRRTNRDAAT